MAGSTYSWPLSFDPSSIVITGGGTLTASGDVSVPDLRARTGLKRRGIRIPMGVNRRGGTHTIVGEDNDVKILSLALSDNQNENAYQQDPGLGAEMIFAVNDAAIRGIIIQRLKDVFAEFTRQNRYTLVEGSGEWTQDDGDLFFDFDYFNIESDEKKHFRGSLRGA